MPVAMKLHASLVVRPPPAPCHLRLSPTALQSDSCNHLAGNNASRSASRVVASRAVASAEVIGGATTSVSPALTAPMTGAKNLSGTGSPRAFKRHATSGGAAKTSRMSRSATGRLPSAATLVVSAATTATTTRKRTTPTKRRAVPTATRTYGAQLLQRYLQLGLTLLREEKTSRKRSSRY